MRSDTYTKVILTIIAALLSLIAYNQVNPTVRARVHKVIGSVGVALLDLLGTGLRKVQGLFLVLLALRISYKFRIYANDHFLGDSWFAFREGDLADLVTVWLLPLGAAMLLLAAFKKYGNSRFPESPLLLVVIPFLTVLVWYPVFDGRLHPAYKGLPETLSEAGKTGCAGSADRGRLFFPAKYDDVDCLSIGPSSVPGIFTGNGGEDLVPVKDSGKWGFADLAGDIVIEPRFDKCGEPRWGLRPCVLGGKWGYVYSASGEDAIPFEYDGADSFSYAEGLTSPLAAVKKSRKWGFIDRLNRKRIAFEFDDTELASVFSAWNRNPYELDERFKRAEAMNFWQKAVYWLRGSAAPPSPAWTMVRNGKLWGVIDSNGRFILDPSVPNDTADGFIKCDTRKPQCYFDRELLFHPASSPRGLALTRDTKWQCKPENPEVTARLPEDEGNGHILVSLLLGCKPE